MREPIEIKIISMGSLWRRRRDSNPRTAYDRYTISNRARSTRLRDFSIAAQGASDIQLTIL